MKDNKYKLFIMVLVIVLLVFNFFSFLLSVTQVDLINLNKLTAKGTAVYSGEVRFCINPPIEMADISSQCGTNLSLHTNETYICNLEYNQSDSNVLNFTKYFDTAIEAYDISSNLGIMTFKPQRDIWGVNHSTLDHESTVVLTEVDLICGGDNQVSYYPYDFKINFINTPPEYYKPLPNISMQEQSSLFAFHLEDYFKDIDGHTLEYSALLTYDSSLVNILVNLTNGRVIISSFDECGQTQITFRAQETDSLELLDTTTSPSIPFSIPCPPPEEEEIGGRSGGGSGGRSVETCIEEWVCIDWSDCYQPLERYSDYLNGYKKKYCYDVNACDPLNSEVIMFEDCIYRTPPGCYPDWDCTDWTPCRKDGTQERTCIDNNKCSLEDQKKYGEIPGIIKLCTYAESCSDGVKNNNELGLDCGGPCEPCSTIELPSTIDNRNKILTWVIGSLTGLIIFLIILFQIFKKQIRKILSKIIWFFVKKTSRQIYLIGASKKRVIIKLQEYEHKIVNYCIKKTITTKNFEHLESELYILSRTIFAEMLDLTIESSKKEFTKKISELETTDEFKEMILEILNRMLDLESKGRKTINSQINEIILNFNTLKFLTFSISDNVNRKQFLDIDFIKQENSEKELKDLLNKLNKAYINLQHKKLDMAKEYYLTTIELYESLEEETKAKIYELTTELFDVLKYVNSHIA